MDWQTTRIGADYDDRAPDGSEIRLLVQVRGGSEEALPVAGPWPASLA